MLIVKIFGGLGNQMFQYAFAKYLEMNNKDVYLDVSDFLVHHHHTGYELKRLFGIKDVEADRKLINSVAVNANLMPLRALKKVCGVEIRRLSEYKGRHFVFVEETTIKENVYFDGYWQNINYLEPIKDKLKETFTFKPALSERNIELQNYILNNECVAVHIRRGDYEKDDRLATVCSVDYYNRAIDFCLSTLGTSIIFVVFSDDIDWVKENMVFPKNAIFVDWNKGNDSYVDMQLMGCCHHSVIANSTFSWWPAWLKSDEKKITIMPQEWFRDESSDRLLFEGCVRL